MPIWRCILSPGLTTCLHLVLTWYVSGYTFCIKASDLQAIEPTSRYEQTFSLSLFWVLSYSHGAFHPHCPLLTACSQFKQKHLMIMIRICNCPWMGEKAQCGVFQYAVAFCVSILAVINNKKHGLHNQSNELSYMWTVLIVWSFVQMNTER